MPRPRKVKTPDAPRSLCPFSGKLLQFVETAGGWQVRAPGWVSTTFYQTKEQAEWDFSFTNGEEPNWVPTWKRIQVGEEREEPLPSAESMVKDAEKAMDAIAEEAEREFSK